MSTLLGSFSSEFRTLQKTTASFTKDALSQTIKTQTAPVTFKGILSPRRSNQPVVVTGGSMKSGGGGALLATKREALLYVELGVSISKGDTIIDGDLVYNVDDVTLIYAFGGKPDHRQADLSLTE